MLEDAKHQDNIYYYPGDLDNLSRRPVESVDKMVLLKSGSETIPCFSNNAGFWTDRKWHLVQADDRYFQREQDNQHDPYWLAVQWEAGPNERINGRWIKGRRSPSADILEAAFQEQINQQ